MKLGKKMLSLLLTVMMMLSLCVLDVSAQFLEVNVSGLTANDGIETVPLEGSGTSTDPYVLIADPTKDGYLLQFAANSTSNESLGDGGIALKLTSNTLSSEQIAAIQAYYSGKSDAYSTYLLGALNGTNAFAVIKSDASNALVLYDGAKLANGSTNASLGMAIPGSFPAATYTLEGTFGEQTFTYVLKIENPALVTLLDINDAIAPINGETPKAVIAETAQYTGTVTWAGDPAPAQFAPGNTYTATIRLTAKSGYTFEGIAENAFKVPCAMSATNDANSGVITATFISPPSGYITDGNGTMAYCYDYNFDIMGFFYDEWKQTTFANGGYGTVYKIGSDDQDEAYASGVPVPMGSSGLTLDVDLLFVSNGKALQVVYTVCNTGAENVSFSLGSHADIMIGSSDRAPISIFDPTLTSASSDRGFKMVSTSDNDKNSQGAFAQFNFFGKRSAGVTDVDTFWYGYYYVREDHVFSQIGDVSYNIGQDSGMAYSWQNRTIGAGETQTYMVIIGIGGADSADVLGYSVAFDNNVLGAVIAVPETQQKIENIALTLSEQVPVRSGYEFAGWNTQADGNGTVYHPGETYTLNANMTLYAQWTQNTPPIGDLYFPEIYSITASGSEGGTITPAGTTNIVEYSSKTYTITPEAGYKISDVLVDGVSVGAIATYTFSSITSNHKIEAKFEHDCPSKKFADVDTSQWYHEGIDFVLLNGLFNGTSDTSFEPNAGMTRAMLVTVLWRLEKEPDSTIANLFADVAEGTWYTDAVIWAAENNIVNGYGDGSFGPMDSITREQMAAILWRFAEYKGYDRSAMADLSGFVDEDDIHSWATDAMSWANANELISGLPGSILAPQDNAIRVQAAAILMRFIENVTE